MAFTGTQQKCKACDKTVYLVDQLPVDGAVYHRSCFRCQHCKGTLKLSNYASLEGVLYCKPHFEQLFKKTGSFNKSFESVKSFFKSQESEAATTPRTPSKMTRLFSGTQEKCVTCTKTVYPLEKVSVEGLPYHKSCFKCVHGGCVLSPSNYAALESRLYCKHHYKQLFKEKGNYSQLTKAPSSKAVVRADGVEAVASA